MDRVPSTSAGNTAKLGSSGVAGPIRAGPPVWYHSGTQAKLNRLNDLPTCHAPRPNNAVKHSAALGGSARSTTSAAAASETLSDASGRGITGVDV